MTYKFFLKTFLAGAGLLGVLTTTATAQGAEPPECYLIDNSGKLTDLTALCNVSQKRSPNTDSVTRKTSKIDDNPECFIIDNSGTRTDLSDFCNVSQKRSSRINAASNQSQKLPQQSVGDPNFSETKLVLDDNQYILGENSLTTEAGAINSTYYIDNAIGADYAAYVRRYQSSPTSLTRQTLREEIFQLNTNESTSERLTSILRDGREVPFFIYRY